MFKWQWLFVVAWVICASAASAQTWYTEFNNGGITLPNGAELAPPVRGESAPDGFYSVAHLKVAQSAALVDSNTLNVSLCNMVRVTVSSASYTGDDGEFYVMGSPDAAKTTSRYIIADVDGDGVIADATCLQSDLAAGITATSDDTGDCVPLDGDGGNNLDGDATARQTASMFGVEDSHMWVRQCTIDDTDAAYVEVECQ